MLLYRPGLRISEALAARPADVDLARQPRSRVHLDQAGLYTPAPSEAIQDTNGYGI